MAGRAHPASLLARLPAGPVLCWQRAGQGLVGWGEAARLEVSGPDRFPHALAWLRDLPGAGRRDLPVGPEGVVAFGSFSFEETESSVLIVPEVLVGRDGSGTWISGTDAKPRPVRAPRRPEAVRYPDAGGARDRYRGVVEAAIRLVGAGRLEKLVVAGFLDARAGAPIDVRWLLGELAAAYPDCWTFAVDGLVGATPELLVRMAGGVVTSRVLAGSGPPDADPAALFASRKDRAEHRYALASVVDGLQPECDGLEVSEPYPLELPNVRHLASDVTGRLREPRSALELAGALHPTAAVAGVPSAAAVAAIAELEAAPRGRYAGPVGWVAADGTGEWCLALRCAQLSGNSARLFAGCGIVAGSEPEAEVAEWLAKLRPVRDALGG